MKEFNLISPSLFSPKAKIPTFSEIFSAFKHHRCLSLKSSPYDYNLKERPKLKIPSHCQSRKKKNNEKTERKLEANKKIKNFPKKKLEKTSAVKESKLVEINDLDVFTAPKIFENQIFTDVYDVNGNHDRVLDLSPGKAEESIEESKIVMGKLEILNDINIKGKNFIDEGRLRPPDNSYLEETKVPNDLHADLLKKLNELALVLSSIEQT